MAYRKSFDPRTTFCVIYNIPQEAISSAKNSPYLIGYTPAGAQHAEPALALTFDDQNDKLTRGYVFGSSPATSDIVLSTSTAARLSPEHFVVVPRFSNNYSNKVEVTSLAGEYTALDGIRLTGATTRVIEGHHPRILQAGTTSVMIALTEPPNHHEAFQAFVNNWHRAQRRAVASEALVDVRQKARRGGRTPIMQEKTRQAQIVEWQDDENGVLVLEICPRTLGRGAFGDVREVISQQDGKHYAMKSIDLRDLKTDWQRERDVLEQCQHERLVKYYQSSEDERYLKIILELAPHGDLGGMLKEAFRQGRSGLNEQDCRRVATQVLQALVYLHDEKVVHRDIKAENILVFSADPLTVKLTDFGLSRFLSLESLGKTCCGTPQCMAPEIFVSSRHSFAVDVYALGMTVCRLLTNDYPLKINLADYGNDMMHTVRSAVTAWRPTERQIYTYLQPFGVSTEGCQFIARLLRRDPSRRPTAKECLSDPWITQGGPTPQVSPAGRTGTRHRIKQYISRRLS